MQITERDFDETFCQVHSTNIEVVADLGVAVVVAADLPDGRRTFISTVEGRLFEVS